MNSQAFKRLDIVALGEAMVEFNQTQPGLPHYLQGFGGDTSNAAIAAARAGASTAYMTRLGGDVFGASLLRLWEQENVDCQAVTTDSDQATGLYFVNHDAKGGHQFSYRRAGSAASQMTPDWLALPPVAATLAQAKILHTSGITLAISPTAHATAFAAMRQARAQGTLVSFDSNIRLKLWSLDLARQAITQAVALCDLFLPSLDDMQALLGPVQPADIIQWAHSTGAKQVVLKLGSAGAIVSDGQHPTEIPGRNVTAVDATGAGDCFCGNLLARLSQGDTLPQAARYANCAASLAVQGFGAVAPLPGREAVEVALLS